MVDVKRHTIFPTIVHQFNCDFNDLTQLDIYQMQIYAKTPTQTANILTQTKDDVHKLSIFNVSIILEFENTLFCSELKSRLPASA